MRIKPDTALKIFGDLMKKLLVLFIIIYVCLPSLAWCASVITESFEDQVDGYDDTTGTETEPGSTSFDTPIAIPGNPPDGVGSYAAKYTVVGEDEAQAYVSRVRTDNSYLHFYFYNDAQAADTGYSYYIGAALWAAEPAPADWSLLFRIRYDGTGYEFRTRHRDGEADAYNNSGVYIAEDSWYYVEAKHSETDDECVIKLYSCDYGIFKLLWTMTDSGADFDGSGSDANRLYYGCIFSDHANNSGTLYVDGVQWDTNSQQGPIGGFVWAKESFEDTTEDDWIEVGP